MIIGHEGGDELGSPMAHPIDLGVGFAGTSRHVVDQLGRDDVAMRKLGGDEVGDGDRVWLTAGVGANFADEGLGGGEADIVTKVDVLPVDAKGGSRVGSAGDAVVTLLVFRQLADSGHLASVVAGNGEFIGEDLVQGVEPGQNGVITHESIVHRELTPICAKLEFLEEGVACEVGSQGKWVDEVRGG